MKVLLLVAAIALVGSWLIQLTVPGIVERARNHDWTISFAELRNEFGSVDTFVPEIWSKKLLSSLKKALVYAAPGVVNRDYEGEINDAGDTVTINSISRPTIGTYVRGVTSIVPEQLTAAQRKLVVDQAKYFAFEVDDVDVRQAAGNMIPEAMNESAYGLRDVADQYVESIMRSGVVSANALGTVAVTSADLAYTKLIALKVVLDEADVPAEGRWAVVPAWYHALLLDNNKFVDASASADGGDALRNGRVGRAAGFDIKMSNNAVLITGDDYSVIAGHPMATSYAEQINKTEAYRPEDSFSDAVKGLHVYGAKVVRPYALATMAASKT